MARHTAPDFIATVPAGDILDEIRGAFDGDEVPAKNVMLRRAHTEIKLLRRQLEICRDVLERTRQIIGSA